MVSVKHRAVVLGVVVLATILVMVFCSTWYGPALLISIPICLAWLSWGVRNEFIKGLGLVLSALVAGASVFLIVLGREAATGWM
jgi:hypothetical protein